MKPRLTEKVLRGLGAMCSAIEGGALLEGDLEPSAADVKAAIRWVDDMDRYRRTQPRTRGAGAGGV
jgi:hypothetical protein